METAAHDIGPQDLPTFRHGISAGVLGNAVQLHPGLSFHADPEFEIAGNWRSPAGRLLELEVIAHGRGHWIGLHVRLDGAQSLADRWIGFACRNAAEGEQMIRPCLRSGVEDGFVDVFFDKHILAVEEPRNHIDLLHPATCRVIPETALWRELVFFLPRAGIRWHLHDLRPILL